MSRKVYILSSPWIRAAAEFLRLKDHLVPNALLTVCWEWSAGASADLGLRHEMQFVWGDSDEYGDPLFDDMIGRWRGPSALESAAAVAESLAYDNTDGPADEVT